MMKSKLAKLLAIILLTLVVFGLNNHLQKGHSANCPNRQNYNQSLTVSQNKSNQYLDGEWQFIPAEPSAQQPPKTGWGSILVPGDWQHENDNSIPGLTKRGTGKIWEKFNGSQLTKAWYQRTILIPQDWQKKTLFLNFQRVSTDAEIYINGIKCGDIDWPYGTVDISRVVKSGKDNTLSILVTAVADQKEKTIIMGPNEMYKAEAKLDSRGLIGAIQLLSLPNIPQISDVFVQPSTRKKQIELDIELTDVTQQETVKVVAQMLNEKGEVEQEFTTNTNVSAIHKQIIKTIWNWQNPRLWDMGKPNLYTLKLSLKGQKISDEYTQQFGFREFWIEGRQFYLNGTEIHLRPIVAEEPWAIAISQVADRIIDGYNFAGYNIAELWPWNHDERGKWHFREDFAQRADLKGFPLIAPALDIAPIASHKTWNSSKANWEKRMATDLRRYRNHPSILIWANSPNFFGHSDDQNPRRIGNKNIEGTITKIEDKRLQQIAPIGEEAISIIKKYDPTRPVMMHQGGSIGDIYALNSYLNMIPLQEREEWLSSWQQKGDMPYMVVEFGTPLHATMMRGRNGFASSVVSEPLMTEFSAIYLGKQAYELETTEYRNKIRELFIKEQEYQNWYGNIELNFAPAFQKLLQLFNTNTWRSWRTMGMTGGMIPWNNGQGWQVSTEGKQQINSGQTSPNQRGVYLKQVPKSLWYNLQPQANIIHPSGQALLQNNNSTLAWIAGVQITAKDHNFTAGEKLHKQVVLINDTRTNQPFSFNWQALVNGQVTKQEKTGTIETGQTLFFPIEINLNQDIIQKIDGEISLKATIGNQQHEDKFAFRIFHKQQKVTGTITAFDPIGKTTKMLQQLGYKVVPWDKKNAPKLLIIGREALSNPLPELENFVRNGGIAIAFTQKPQFFQKLGFRISPHQTRRVFPVNTNHPILNGLDELDLRDWQGESTLIEAYPNTLNQTDVKRSPHGVPWYGWHWSNRGTLSSATIEKPHNSSWRPILEAEFDLAYSPLMELDYGKGRLILNTLDLEDHVPKDAAAAKITQQIIEYGANKPLSPKANQVILIGNKLDQAKLDALGLIYQSSNSLITESQLTIIGAEANVEDQELKAYLNNGGKVFLLPRNSPDTALEVRLQQGKIATLPTLPNWQEVSGISTSDLHSRTNYDNWLIQSGGEVASNGLLSRITVGKGVAIFCQIDPEKLNADQNTYFRYTRWRQTRTISQILANMGASFKADSVIFKPNNFNLYHLDYRTDFDLGDDPYRYYRW
jgi:beta-galactosidase